MNKISQIAFILLCLSTSIWLIRNNIEQPNSDIDQRLINHKPSDVNLEPTPESKQVKTPRITSLDQQVSTLLSQHNFIAAVDTFNSAYDDLDESAIKSIQVVFYKTTKQYLNQKKALSASRLMTEYLSTIQDENAYILLARAHVMQKNYRAAIDASISAYGLAFDSLSQQRIEQYAVKIALNYAIDEQNNKAKQLSDNVSDVLHVMTELHYLFPENAQLIFETAKLLIATGDAPTAQQYLSKLLYANNDYSSAAKSLLNTLVQQQTPSTKDTSPQNQTSALQRTVQTKSTPANSITITLRRSGSSYLVDANINQSPVTLLLDTGASITALSDKLVDRLNLDKTNRKVRLSTANGTRTSPIYHADSLQFGGIQLNKIAVVEIDLGRSTTHIDGLLGTDVLQQFNYQIDNSTHSLILTPR